MSRPCGRFNVDILCYGVKIIHTKYSKQVKLVSKLERNFGISLSMDMNPQGFPQKKEDILRCNLYIYYMKYYGFQFRFSSEVKSVFDYVQGKNTELYHVLDFMANGILILCPNLKTTIECVSILYNTIARLTPFVA